MMSAFNENSHICELKIILVITKSFKGNFFIQEPRERLLNIYNEKFKNEI